MPNKKSERIPFNTENDFLKGTAVPGAPVVGGEFVTADGEMQGQTVQVESQTHLEDDHGTGEAVIIRTFEFAANPEAFAHFKPNQQQIFESHQNFINAMLWQDGLSPALDIAPVLVPSKTKDRYLIMVGARPSVGQVVLDTSQTLSQIAHAGKQHSDQVHGIV